LLHVIHYGIHLTDRLHESDIKTHSEQDQTHSVHHTIITSVPAT